ncbi:MAG: hypothetical protein ACXAC7_09785 [Candidatus Hodarchaeales archaeon]|jgi:hypothetical protein
MSDKTQVDTFNLKLIALAYLGLVIIVMMVIFSEISGTEIAEYQEVFIPVLGLVGGLCGIYYYFSCVSPFKKEFLEPKSIFQQKLKRNQVIISIIFITSILFLGMNMGMPGSFIPLVTAILISSILVITLPLYAISNNMYNKISNFMQVLPTQPTPGSPTPSYGLKPISVKDKQDEKDIMKQFQKVLETYKGTVNMDLLANILEFENSVNLQKWLINADFKGYIIENGEFKVVSQDDLTTSIDNLIHSFDTKAQEKI